MEKEKGNEERIRKRAERARSREREGTPSLLRGHLQKGRRKEEGCWYKGGYRYLGTQWRRKPSKLKGGGGVGRRGRETK